MSTSRHGRPLRNNKYEKDGETVFGMAFTDGEIEHLNIPAGSAARRDGDWGAATAAATRKPRNARQSAHADAEPDRAGSV